MKQSILLLLIMLNIPLCTIIKAQNTTIIKVNNEKIPIQVESINIEVKVIGAMAKTATTMVIFNPNEEVLEGELNFPLSEGQQVIGYGLDINGKMRKGVVVEKSLGRSAFEGVVRQQIDPGLLEMTEGNNYRTRIYPIPAKGRRTIYLEFESAIKGQKDPLYHLQLQYGIVKKFNLKVEVYGNSIAPKIQKNSIVQETFNAWNRGFLMEEKRIDFNAQGPITIQIPKTNIPMVFRASDPLESKFHYFSASVYPKLKESKKRSLPKSIAIFWDVSHSGKERALEKELALLEQYLSRFKKVKVTLIPFSNCLKPKQNFQLDKDGFEEIRKYIKKLQYDGATNFAELNFDKVTQEEILLFSDGISNLGNLPSIQSSIPIQVIHSSAKADPVVLSNIAEQSGGVYLNLVQTSISDALDRLTFQHLQFIGLKYDEKVLQEVYPNAKHSIAPEESFLITGKIQTNANTTVELLFGTNGKITHTNKISIPKTLDKTLNIKRLWATKKIEMLQKQHVPDRSEIIALAKENSLVTPYTSLIVLDRVEDYVRYAIPPPPELHKEYSRLIKQKKNEKERSKTEIVELAIEEHQAQLDWWYKNEKDTSKYIPKSNSEAQGNTSSTTISSPPSLETATPQNLSTNLEILSDTLLFNKKYTGYVLSADDDSPLPGVNVMIKGTTIGTVTNLEGYYDINVRENDILLFSFVGLNSLEVSDSIMENFPESIRMTSDVTQLSEVVVSAYRTITRSNATASYTTMSVQQVLQGQIAGVTISNGNGTNASPNSTQILESKEQTVVIRGNSSVVLEGSPLYIIDGVIQDPDAMEYFDKETMQSINVIKADFASKFFGSRAVNGVIIVQTSNAEKETMEAMDSLSSYFEPSLALKNWKADAPYLKTLKQTDPLNRKSVYFDLKKEYHRFPAFFLEVGTFFIDQKEEAFGAQVLGNIVELTLENMESLKVLAHKLKALGQVQNSIFLYEKIEQLRPEEPHSKRDLALALQKAGQYQQALDLFVRILETDFEGDIDDRFPYFKSIVLTEMNNLIARHKRQLDLSRVPKDCIHYTPIDIRVVMDWNVLETDIDLWVTEPSGEKCGYENDLTKNGGFYTSDFMDGYGPEEYLIKSAEKGNYSIEIDFYDERAQKLSGPVIVQVSIFKNYGRKNQTVTSKLVELKEEEGTLTIAQIEWN